MANQILKFGTSVLSSNILTQAEYAAAAPSPRTSGHVPGIASNKLENKALIQTATIAAGVAEWMSTRQTTIPDITDQLTSAEIVTAMDASTLAALPASTTAVVGKTRFATSAETQAGASALVAVTPAGLQSKVSSTTALGISRFATSAEIIAGTQSLVGVSPSSLGPITASFTASGYARLPGGLIVQWGSASSSGSITPTFPIAFPGACFGVQINATNRTDCGVSSFTPTGFVASAGANGETIWWFAYGH